MEDTPTRIKRSSPTSDDDSDANEARFKKVRTTETTPVRMSEAYATLSGAPEDQEATGSKGNRATDHNQATEEDTNKRAQKLAMNRESARARRHQKKLKMEQLELRTALLTRRNQSLATANEALVRRVAELERELETARSTSNASNQGGEGSANTNALQRPSASPSTAPRSAESDARGVSAAERVTMMNLRLRLEAERASLLARSRDEASSTSSSLRRLTGTDLPLLLSATTRSQLSPSTRTFLETTLLSPGRSSVAASAPAPELAVLQRQLLSGDLSFRGPGPPMYSTRTEWSELQYLRLLAEARSHGDLLASDALNDRSARLQALTQQGLPRPPSLHQNASMSTVTGAQGVQDAASSVNRLFSGADTDPDLGERRQRLDDIFERIRAAGSSGPLAEETKNSARGGYR